MSRRDFDDEDIQFIADAIKEKKERESKGCVLGGIVAIIIFIYLGICELDKICLENLHMTLENVVINIGLLIISIIILINTIIKINRIRKMNYRRIVNEYHDKFRKEYIIVFVLSSILLIMIIPLLLLNDGEEELLPQIFCVGLLFLFTELFKRLIIIIRYDNLKGKRKRRK